MMAYAASVGSARAQAQGGGRLVFIGNANAPPTAQFLGPRPGARHHGRTALIGYAGSHVARRPRM